jgi:2-phosphosulfolactate phosphatase
MTRVDVVLTADSITAQQARGKLCVVVDVLRATTTIAAALFAGCPAVIPAETPEEAREIARSRGCLLGGERESVRIEGFDFGNSPLEYTPEKIDGRPIAFTTTNGTRAMRACDACETLVAASFVNRDAVVRFLKQSKNDILIVCAGTRGEPSIEDTACAGMLIDSLGESPSPSNEAQEAVAIWNRSRDSLGAMMKKEGSHGRSLVALGFERDVDFAAALNKCDALPVRIGDTLVRIEQ